MTRLAVICDYLEENWLSMDIVARQLLGHLRASTNDIRAEEVRPPVARRIGRLPLLGSHRLASNMDRWVSRYWDYPRYIRRRAGEFDLFHICDHSYAQLVHFLPAERTGVFCHDLDAFRCLLEPGAEPRSTLFRAAAWRTLRGLQKARVVFHTTRAVRRQIERHGLLDPARLIQAPNGVSEVFWAPPHKGAKAPADLAMSVGQDPFLLHVGNCIPRKRVDVLLEVFAGLSRRHPGLRLVQVGGAWTAAHRALIRRRGLGPHVHQLRRQTETDLAAIYRRAALFAMTSEAEGFGIPVAEALACGAIVIASDIPALREVGGEAAVFCPVGDIPAWVEVLDRLISSPLSAPSAETRRAQARRFSWAEYARIIGEAYRRLS